MPGECYVNGTRYNIRIRAAYNQAFKKNTKRNITTDIDYIINLKYRHEAFNNQQAKYHTNCNRNLIVNFYFHFN